MPKVLQRHFLENLIEERENFTSPESKCCLIVSHLLFPPVSLYQTIINQGADSILVTKPDCNVIVLCAQSLCCFHCKSVGLIQNYFCSQLQSVRYILLLNSNLSLSLMWLKTLRWSWSKVLLLTLLFPCVPPFQHFLIILGRYHMDIKGRVKTYKNNLTWN